MVFARQAIALHRIALLCAGRDETRVGDGYYLFIRLHTILSKRTSHHVEEIFSALLEFVLFGGEGRG